MTVLKQNTYLFRTCTQTGNDDVLFRTWYNVFQYLTLYRHHIRIHENVLITLFGLPMLLLFGREKIFSWKNCRLLSESVSTVSVMTLFLPSPLYVHAACPFQTLLCQLCICGVKFLLHLIFLSSPL